MIKTKDALKKFLKIEKKIFSLKKNKRRQRILLSENYLLWQYLRFLRLEKFHNNLKHIIRFVFYSRRKNKCG